MTKCPCQACTDRHFNCHTMCRRYKDWKKENDDTKAWLKDQRPCASDRTFQAYYEKIRRRARGQERTKGGG